MSPRNLSSFKLIGLRDFVAVKKANMKSVFLVNMGT